MPRGGGEKCFPLAVGVMLQCSWGRRWELVHPVRPGPGPGEGGREGTFQAVEPQFSRDWSCWAEEPHKWPFKGHR